MIKIEYLEETQPVYDITVKDNENFYANNILVHNCSEILLPVTPLQSADDPDAEVALCILSNINASRVQIDEMPKLASLIVRGLDNIIDSQDYPLPAAENSAKNGRYLGIGVSDWAHKLTREKVRYDSNEALDITEEYMEHWQYNLLLASMELAKEKEPARWFADRSRYADGWLPNDGKQRFIKKSTWNQLRRDIVQYGLRNLTLSAIPPAGTSSDVSNSTSGIDMVRDFVITKKSKGTPFKMIVPNFAKGSSYYTFVTDPDFDNIKYLTMVSKFQLYVDQSISTNTYYDEKDFINDKIPMSKIINTIKTAHRLGLKTLYYTNFDDQSIAQNSNGEDGDCDGGGCSV